ncbi:MAG: magnesium/cobalt transporter CorA [Sandaracinaceae bacterium]
MSKAAKRRRKKTKHHRSKARVGAPPGTLELPEDATASKVRVFSYDDKGMEEANGLAALDAMPKRRVTWVDVVGLGSLDVVSAVAERFGLHPLSVEDVLQTHQRAKIEDYPGTMFVVTRLVRECDGALDIEQESMFIGSDFVVTFQEREGDSFEPVRERLRQGKGRIRAEGAAYLAYALLDAAVDGMFPLLELYADRIEALEQQVFETSAPELAETIHGLKQEMVGVRRAVVPLREAIGRLVRDENPLIDKDVRIYLRDCLDHLSQLVDLLDGHRDTLSALMEAHQSNISQRSNEVMKVLTMMTSLFIPMSFIAGLYGMNFDPAASPYNMPELRWAFGYPTVISIMLAIAVAMFVYFRRKRWL